MLSLAEEAIQRLIQLQKDTLGVAGERIGGGKA
jgi:ribonuclease PH